MPHYVKIDHIACTSPGRLRHSWLENEVFMFLKPEVRPRLQAFILARQIVAWAGYLVELDGYAREFPSVIDPGNFLKYFANKNGRSVSLSLDKQIQQISKSFADEFQIRLNMSHEDFRSQLDKASKQLAIALSQLEREAASAREPMVSKLAFVDAAWQAANEVHRLLGMAPRGIVLP